LPSSLFPVWPPSFPILFFSSPGFLLVSSSIIFSSHSSSLLLFFCFFSHLAAAAWCRVWEMDRWLAAVKSTAAVMGRRRQRTAVREIGSMRRDLGVDARVRGCSGGERDGGKVVSRSGHHGGIGGADLILGDGW
jgi:hypothetical protein